MEIGLTSQHCTVTTLSQPKKSEELRVSQELRDSEESKDAQKMLKRSLKEDQKKLKRSIKPAWEKA